MNDYKKLFSDNIGLVDCTFKPVSGGDINTCWKLESAGFKYFLKTNSASSFPGMFQKEAEGLKALKSNSSFIIPAVIVTGIIEDEQFLLMEWLEKITSQQDHQKDAGEKLAGMHLRQQDWFGWNDDNYIGSLQQVNSRHQDWSSFYTECRILPIAKLLADQKKIPVKDLQAAEKFCLRLREIFPSEPASFLHGDLWAGNYMVTTKGPALFDPAVYYGHREMDLGMAHLFGGFDENFYRSYEEIFPLEKGWRNRINYSQLYPLLVHAVLFGGHYIEKAMGIMKFFK